jgi:hypothetical protein
VLNSCGRRERARHSHVPASFPFRKEKKEGNGKIEELEKELHMAQVDLIPV